MSYNPNIPQSSDFLSVSQTDLLTNFTQLDDLFGQDHEKFSAGSNQGKHNKSTYLEQSTAPSTAANEGALYAKAISGITQLFFRDESNGTEHQMTGIVPGQTGTHYGIDLAAGIQLRFGELNVPFVGPIPFQTPFSTIGYMCLISPVGAVVERKPNVVRVNATQFRVVVTGAIPGLVYYLAIGR